MKKLLSNTPAKIAAFFLCVLFGVTALFSTIAAIFAYDTSSAQLRNSAFAFEIANRQADNCAMYFLDDLSQMGIYSDSWESGVHGYEKNDFSPAKSNIYAEIIDKDGNIVLQTSSEIKDYSDYTPIAYMDWERWEEPDALDTYLENHKPLGPSKFKDNAQRSAVSTFHYSDTPAYRLIVCMNSKFTADDDLRSLNHTLEVFYHFKTIYIPLAVTSAILCLVLFVFLMTAAGRRREEDAENLKEVIAENSRGNTVIALRFIDRIPFDLLTFLFLCIMGIFLALNITWADSGSVLPSFFCSHPVVFVILLALGAGICFAVALAWLMTIATRFKARTLLKNNLICRLFIGIKHFVKHHMMGKLSKGLQSLRLIWFSVILLGIWAFINFMIEVNGPWDPYIRLPQLFLFNLICIIGLLMLILQMAKLEEGAKRMSDGDFDTKIDTKKMIGPFKNHAQHLNSIGDGMNIAVEERMKSERMKTELITNVSHDIKTPLTSIVNYVDLLKKEDLDNPTAAGYVEVLDRQATRLRKLIEDLIEASKASTGNMKVNRETINICELLLQSTGEYEERFAENELRIITNIPEEGAFIRADGRLLWRVIDNLMNNIHKYAMPGSRVYADIKVSKDHTSIMLKNISRDELNVSSDELIERFVRGDSARTSEGSGLGLSIANSLTSLMGGIFELSVDGDLFKVMLLFPNASVKANGGAETDK